mmetsp:Transcript_26174/g.87663  ORF Transcript_26174/g.87663 Transcript_26174/m.87663 type:complete len:220 (-) Transcript_26174:571-1230(-)
MHAGSQLTRRRPTQHANALSPSSCACASKSIASYEGVRVACRSVGHGPVREHHGVEGHPLLRLVVIEDIQRLPGQRAREPCGVQALRHGHSGPCGAPRRAVANLRVRHVRIPVAVGLRLFALAGREEFGASRGVQLVGAVPREPLVERPVPRPRWRRPAGFPLRPLEHSIHVRPQQALRPPREPAARERALEGHRLVEPLHGACRVEGPAHGPRKARAV